MLRSLLILCWAATIVSAGDLNNNNTSVPIKSNDNKVVINSQLPSDTTELSGSSVDKDVKPSVLPESSAPTASLKKSSNENMTSTDSMNIPQIVIPSTISTSKSTPPSTAAPTTISTVAPTTASTAKPITTSTHEPITTPKPIPSTTSAPISTTTSAPISTTPLPPPTTGKWKVEENNTVCIVVQMAVQFDVSYKNVNNATINKTMDIPSNSSMTGKCGESDQSLTLSWESQSNSTPIAQNSFTLHFIKNDTDKHYSLHNLEISLVMKNSSTDKSNNMVTLIHMAPEFNTGLSNSYRCLKEQSLSLTLKDSNDTVGQLKLSHLQFQAFRSDNTTVFGLAKDCSFDTPDIVPITVGCALAGLVVVVLIAYLVGRRRSQSRGYLSM